MPPATLPAGTVIGAWRVERHIASGGFAAVYAVAHTESGRAGALKLLHAHLAATPELTARALREAEVMAALSHPGIVELLGTGLADDGRPYLVLERLDGRDLARELAERGRLPPAEVVTIIEAVAAALDVAHRRGVVHRDVKASNVFLAGWPETRRVVLLDFGIAKLLALGSVRLTSSRQTVGSPASMAPEQIRGGAIDARTDVYALGALAYHLLTGRPPFEHETATLAQYLHLHAARPRPSARSPVSPAIDAEVTRAMAIDPAARHESALAFHAALAAAVRGVAPAGGVPGDAVGVLLCLTPAGERDAALRADVERVVQLAQLLLARSGFWLAADHGDTALFVAVGKDGDAARDAMTAAAREVAARDAPDPRLAVGWRGHRAPVLLHGDLAAGGPLFDLASWGMPAAPGGVWCSPALGRGESARSP